MAGRPSLNNRVLLITGAGSGIGRQLALEFARRGAAIAALDLNAELLERLSSQLKEANHACAWAVADVTDRDLLFSAVKSLGDQLGPVDVLIASAGIGLATPALDFQAADFERLVHVNLIGVANSIAAVLPGMLQRRGGHLVALSSLASCRGLPFMAGYSAAKAGVNCLMDSLRLELRPHGIRCTTICPGWVRTPLLENASRVAAERWGHPTVPAEEMLTVDDAARRIVKAIVAGRPYVSFPRPANWIAGLLHALPVTWSDRVVRLIGESRKVPRSSVHKGLVSTGLPKNLLR